MGDKVSPHKRSLIIFYPNLHPYRSRNLLQLPQKTPHSLSIRGNHSPSNHRGSFSGVCTSMGTNIILGGNSNYKNNYSYPLCWKRNYSMTMGKLFSIPTHLKSLLFSSLLNPFRYCSPGISASYPATRRGILKSYRRKHQF